MLRKAEEIAREQLAGRTGREIRSAHGIVALADVFDALVRERPYKTAWPIERARTEIRRLSGRQFDPDGSTPSRASMPICSPTPDTTTRRTNKQPPLSAAA